MVEKALDVGELFGEKRHQTPPQRARTISRSVDSLLWRMMGWKGGGCDVVIGTGHGQFSGLG